MITKSFQNHQIKVLERELEQYKKAYHIFMDVYDNLHDDDKKEIHDLLKVIGL